MRALKLYLQPEIGSPDYRTVEPKEIITVKVLPEVSGTEWGW